MNDELKETVKATQEIAKAAKTAIEATEKLGKFVGNLVAEPFEEIVAILTDKLKFIRWERQVRLTERIREIIERKGLSQFRVIPPKFAIPIIENASIEENDELQDLWTKLLVTSIDPKKDFPRYSFIDILKQLDVVDVHLLKAIYDEYIKLLNRTVIVNIWRNEDPTEYAILGDKIMFKLEIERRVYQTAIDNLMRMRLVTYYVSSDSIETPFGYKRVADIAGYPVISLTSLGVDFIEACI